MRTPTELRGGMTGHNHYPDCQCGWCVGGGSGHGARVASFDIPAASGAAGIMLRRNGIRSRAACYVNHNARCPVCGEGVFFYSNANGSRVFFDELGPHWDKHPCTDNPRVRSLEEPPALQRRAKGTIRDLTSAIATSGLFPAGFLKADGWKLCIVVRSVRIGDHFFSAYEVIGEEDGIGRAIRYASPFEILAKGDVFAMRGATISCLDPRTLTPIEFLFFMGPSQEQLAEPVERVIPDLDDVVLPMVRMRPKGQSHRSKPNVRPTSKVIRGKPKVESARRGFDPRDMTEAETVHFHGRERLDELLNRLGPVVRAYARNGIRKPHDVARKLRSDGHRTAAGAPWTPRLVTILLALMFRGSSERSSVRPAKSKEVVDAPSMIVDTASFAEKLSRIGRVLPR